jgi:uncharacterized protein DUF4340
MNRRMLIVAGVLVIFVAIFANPFKDQLKREKRDWVTVFDKDKVKTADRIEVATANDSSVVVKQGDGWVVASQNSFPADTAAVGNLLRALENARSAGVVSNNPENRSRFQVDASGVRVKVLAQNATIAEFTLGKMGADFTTSYVLPAGSNEVQVVRGLNRNLVWRPQGMRDRTIFKFDVANLKQVTAETPEGGWELVKTDTTWSVRKRGEENIHPADKTLAGTMVQSLSDFSADAFLDNASDTVRTGLDHPDYRYTLRFMDGTESSMAVGRENDRNQYYAQRPDRPTAVYLLSEWRLTNVKKTVEELEGLGVQPESKTAAKPAAKHSPTTTKTNHPGR